MKKLSVLVMTGLVALGVGAMTACGPTAPAEEDLIGKVLMTGEFEGFGGGTIELSLREGGKAFFDATCNELIPNMPEEQVQKMFDKEATYTVLDNVYTFTVDWAQPGHEPFLRTYVTEWDEAAQQHTLDYVLVGQKELPAKLTGKLPNVATPKDKLNEVVMSGEFEGFGGGTIELTLKEGGHAFFDATCNELIPNMPEEQVQKMFDKEATYTVKGNEYTFTVDWAQPGHEPFLRTYVTTWDEETKQHTLEYVLVGQKELPATLTGCLTK